MDTQKQPYLPVTALCIDIDHTDEQTKDIFVRACLLEYVLGAFISISGRGVKLFIRIDIDGVNDYPAIYEATAKFRFHRSRRRERREMQGYHPSLLRIIRPGRILQR